MRKVFISYCHRDIDFVRRLTRDLTRFGYPVWIDEREIKYGAPLRQTIEKAIEECAVVIAVISSSSLQSDWVKHELDLAMQLSFETEKTNFIPLLVEDVQPPLAIRNRKYADFRNHIDYHEALGLLMNDLPRQDADLPQPADPYLPSGYADS